MVSKSSYIIFIFILLFSFSYSLADEFDSFVSEDNTLDDEDTFLEEELEDSFEEIVSNQENLREENPSFGKKYNLNFYLSIFLIFILFLIIFYLAYSFYKRPKNKWRK